MPRFLGRGGKDEGIAPLVQRKGHDLALRRGAPPFGEGLDVGHMAHALGRHHRAEGHHAREARAFGAEQGRTHHGVDAVRANECVQPGHFAAIGEGDVHALPRLRDLAGALAQLHLVQRKGIGQGRQQVRAVDGELGRAVFALGLVTHGQARGFLARVPVAADAVRGPCGAGAHGGGDVGAQAIEGAHGIGREVDVRAHAQELPALLEHQYFMPCLVQRIGCRQSANACSDDAYPQTRHGSCLLLVGSIRW